MSSESRTFIDRCLAGEALLNDVDAFVKQWHEGSAENSLGSFLGMTDEEYEVWVERPESLQFILASRHFGCSLTECLRGDGGIAMAARAASAAEADQLVRWLKQTGRI